MLGIASEAGYLGILNLEPYKEYQNIYQLPARAHLSFVAQGIWINYMVLKAKTHSTQKAVF